MLLEGRAQSLPRNAPPSHLWGVYAASLPQLGEASSSLVVPEGETCPSQESGCREGLEYGIHHQEASQKYAARGRPPPHRSRLVQISEQITHLSSKHEAPKLPQLESDSSVIWARGPSGAWGCRSCWLKCVTSTAWLPGTTPLGHWKEPDSPWQVDLKPAVILALDKRSFLVYEPNCSARVHSLLVGPQSLPCLW